MKRLVLFLFVAVLIVGCATTYYDSEGNPVPKEKMEQLRTAAVKAHLAEHRYRIFVDRMYPMRGPAVYLQNEWGMEVSGDSVGLFLPYFGRVYHVPYGRGGGLTLVEPLTSYKEEPMKDGRRIFMTTRSDFESYQIVLEVFNNATVSLVVNPSGKETISFSGVMELNDTFTPKGHKTSKKRQTTFMKL
ncbi:DUF4251 domain-containing protein [Prevotella melaninogenica]|uniref:DUF4251 domain-containing protein n=1 Tax=Prevotella melaninogenica TaxID=28132 RepID=A0A250KG18_9BACT|nr:DUF4251 domain-containing protein [Prevotella melaninogenica]BBA28598.1 hypothetical protein PMEL1_00502 [Prevotella melaninogenica]